MPEISTEYLALYGAILSTLSFITAAILAWLRFRESRKSIRVDASYGSHQTVAGPNPCIVLTAMNSGHRPLSIVGAFIEAENVLMGAGEIDLTKNSKFNLIKQKVPMFLAQDLPIRIEEGERATIKFHFSSVRQAFAGIPLTGLFVIDGEENWHYATVRSDLKSRLREPVEA